jgi:endo-1,4-beta-D-glucanase Y
MVDTSTNLTPNSGVSQTQGTSSAQGSANAYNFPVSKDEIRRILSQSWEHYKNVMISPEGRPYADADNIGGGKGGYLTYSETVAYVLLRAVITGDKETFMKVWNWAKNNMQLSNVQEVFHWNANQREANTFKTHMLAWRYSGDIKDGKGGGIIKYEWIQGDTWRSGLEPAADADQDIAAALYMAGKKWGNEELTSDAADIVSDIWKLCVKKVGGDYYLAGGPQFRDKCEVNPSYLRPAYMKMFSAMDPQHPWNKLIASSYKVIVGGADAALGNDLGKVNLPPNWLEVDGAGRFEPSFTFQTQNDQGGDLFGWDAFRTIFFVTLDYAWFARPEAQKYLTDNTGTKKDFGPRSFLEKMLRNNKLNAGFFRSGKTVPPSSDWFKRNLDSEQYTQDGGAYLPYFYYSGDVDAAKQVYDKLMSQYNEKGFWGSPHGYYDQNWIWFGLALIVGITPEGSLEGNGSAAPAQVTTTSSVQSAPTPSAKKKNKDTNVKASDEDQTVAQEQPTPEATVIPGEQQAASTSTSPKLDEKIKDLAVKMNSTSDPGKQTEIICELISYRLMRSNPAKGSEASDIDVVKEYCATLIKKSDYGEGIGKIYKAQIMLEQMQEGKVIPSLNEINSAMKLSDDGKEKLANPISADDANGNVNVKKSAFETVGGTSGKGSFKKGYGFYGVVQARIINLQLRALRKGPEDTNKKLLTSYNNLLASFDGPNGYLSGVNSSDMDQDKKDKAIMGLKLLKETVRIQMSALSMSTEDTGKISSAIADIEGSIKTIESLDSEIKKGDLDDGGITPYPTESFDYQSAKIIRADLKLKLALLTGDDSSLAGVKEAYQEAAQKVSRVGSNRTYISTWANIGLINYAVATNTLKGLELYFYDNGKISSQKYMDKQSAISGAIQFLFGVNSNHLLPKGTYLACQTLLIEANLRLMRNSEKEKDTAREKQISEMVLQDAGNINDKEAKYDLIARAKLVQARAIAYDPTRRDDTAEIAVNTIDSAIEILRNDVEAAAADLHKYSEEGKHMDMPFQAEASFTLASLLQQKAQIYKGMADEVSALSKNKNGQSLEAGEFLKKYNKNSDDAIAEYAKAKGFCDPKVNRSKYDAQIRTKYIDMGLFDLEVSKQNISDPDDYLEVMKTLEGYAKKVDVNGKDLGGDLEKDDKDQIIAQRFSLKANILARIIFLLNNQKLYSGNAETETDVSRKMDGFYAEINDLFNNKALATAIKNLPEGVAANLYSVIISADMIELGNNADETITQNIIDNLQGHCFKAMGIKDLADLENKDAQWIMPYNIGEALAIAGLKVHDNDLTKAASKYSFERIIAIDGPKLKDKKLTALDRKRMEESLVKSYSYFSNLILWTQHPEDPENLSDDPEIKDLIRAEAAYQSAIDLGLKDVSLVVNQQEARIRRVSGKKAVKKADVIAKLNEYIGIVGKLDTVAGKMGKLNTDNMNYFSKKKALDDYVAGLKGMLWKANILLSVSGLAKKEEYRDKIAAIAGPDIKKFDLNTAQGIKDMQLYLFNKINGIYKDVEDSLKTMKDNNVSDKQMESYGMNLGDLYNKKADAFASLAMISDDDGLETAAFSAYEKSLDFFKDNPEQQAIAKTGIANLLTWRGKSNISRYENAIKIYEEIIGYYKGHKLPVPLAVNKGHSDCLIMLTYKSIALNKNNSPIGYDKRSYNTSVSILSQQIEASGKKSRSDSWADPMLKSAEMTMVIEGNKLSTIKKVVGDIEAVLDSKEVVPADIAVDIAQDQHKQLNTVYSTSELCDMDKKLTQYSSAVIAGFTSQDSPYFYDEYALRALVDLGVAQGRMLSLIQEVKYIKDPEKKAAYLKVWNNAISNLENIQKLLVKLNNVGPLAGTLKGKTDDAPGYIDQITVWITNLYESKFDFLGSDI